MRIDAHQHFWKLDLPFNYGWLHTEQHEPICRSYLPKDLKTHLDKCGIDKSVFVQTQHDVAENRWVLGLAEQNDFIAHDLEWTDGTEQSFHRLERPQLWLENGLPTVLFCAALGAAAVLRRNARINADKEKDESS